jgi:hypothetical protein
MAKAIPNYRRALEINPTRPIGVTSVWEKKAKRPELKERENGSKS